MKPSEYGLIYLATPYSKYPSGIEFAFADAAALGAGLMRRGYKVYSPIAHTHPLARFGNVDPMDHAIWLPFDEAMMEKADSLFIAKMAGYKESFGIQHELNFFRERLKPVYMVGPHSHVVEEFSGPLA